MRILVASTFLSTALLASCAWAETSQPYAGLQEREIKSLSPEEIADLRAGRGMGLALVAELNGYPGPRHVIELAEALELTAQQVERMQALVIAMQAETVAIGRRLIDQEAALEQLFAEKTVTPASLSEATQAIGATQAALREAHLKYHLATVDILRRTQIERYSELRGYSGGEAATGHSHSRSESR